MGRKCIVPYCKSGYGDSSEKVSVFLIPKHKLSAFREAIQREDRILTAKDVVCAKHFREEDIVRKVVTPCYTYDLKFPRLAANAIPSIFPECPKYIKPGNIRKRRIGQKPEIKRSKCCVPGCKSNDLSAIKGQRKNYVTSFQLPIDEKRRTQWIRAIPKKNWTPSEDTVVCCRHFNESDLIRYNNIYPQPDGTIKQFRVRFCRPKLKITAVPSIFPPNVKAKKKAQNRTGSKKRHKKLSKLEKDMENYMEYKLSSVRSRMKPDVLPHKFSCQPDRNLLFTNKKRVSKKRARKREKSDYLHELEEPSKTEHHVQEIDTEQKDHSEPSTSSNIRQTDYRQTMPRLCCVSGCTSNYKDTLSSTGYVSTFSFPKDEERRRKWIASIHPKKTFHGNTVSKSSFVCVKHFADCQIIRVDTMMMENGSIIEVPRQVPKLTSDAVPTLFLNQHSCGSVEVPLKRKHPDEKRLGLDINNFLKEDVKNNVSHIYDCKKKSILTDESAVLEQSKCKIVEEAISTSSLQDLPSTFAKNIPIIRMDENSADCDSDKKTSSAFSRTKTSCAVPGCGGRYVKNKISMHALPLDRKLKEAWIRECKIEETALHKIRICSVHFCEDDFYTFQRLTRPKLRPHAVPSCKLPESYENARKLGTSVRRSIKKQSTPSNGENFGQDSVESSFNIGSIETIIIKNEFDHNDYVGIDSSSGMEHVDTSEMTVANALLELDEIKTSPKHVEIGEIDLEIVKTELPDEWPSEEYK